MKGVELCLVRRESGEVEANAAEPAKGGGFGRGLQIVGLKLGGDEIVDGVSWPVRGVGGWDRDFFRKGNEGPVRFVFGALFDPSSDDFFFGIGEGEIRFRSGHDLIGVV